MPKPLGRSSRSSSRSPSRLIAPLLGLLAAPLLSCAAEVLEERPSAGPASLESSAATGDGSPSRELGVVNVGRGQASLAYLRGSALRTTVDPEAESVDPFAFVLDTPAGETVALPDFSALGRRGYRFGYSGGDFLRSPVYATTSRGDVYYFEGYVHGADGAARYGYAVAHASPGRDAEVFEVPSRDYAFFPSALLVRGPGDVFVGASVVKQGTFGPDFPGCPISILHGQNGTYLAHLDASGLRELPFPGEGRLDTLSFADDGSLVVDTGWPGDSGDLGEANVRERWTMSPTGAWTRVSRSVLPATPPM